MNLIAFSQHIIYSAGAKVAMKAARGGLHAFGG